MSSIATEGGWLETPIPQELGDQIGTIPGVRRVEAWRALLGEMYRGQRIGLLAMDDAILDPARYVAAWYVEGNPVSAAAAALRAGTGVNVSTSLADRFDLHAGMPITLDSPSGAVTLQIAGVVHDYLCDGGASFSAGDSSQSAGTSRSSAASTST